MNLKDYAPWLDGENIRPYILAREENRSQSVGDKGSDFHWFSNLPTLVRNPLYIQELEFCDLIMDIEGRAFHGSNMAMPRWVFFDCAVMPGFVAGFAHRTQTLPEAIKHVFGKPIQGDWVPLSLFITIPTTQPGVWVAHNLTSINSLLSKKDRFYSLGFLTKAFGLWYGGISTLFGMTQWENLALKLHSYYGNLEILTAFTPVHSHPRTVTYSCDVDPYVWERFFTKRLCSRFKEQFKYAGFDVNPKDREHLLNLQRKIEKKEGRFFLDTEHLRSESLGDPIPIYRPL